MSCPRAQAVDLAAFRVEPALPELDDFRRHYPTCADCSREVAAWSRLEAALRDAGGGGAHPGEERLLAFQDAPRSLAAEERRAIERHLAGCAQCRSEVAVLRGFDLRALAEAGAAAPAAAVSGGTSGGGVRAALTRLAETLFGVPRPAFALLVLVALAVPAVWLSWRTLTRAPEPLPVAQRERPAERGAPPAPAETEGPELPRVQIAREEVAPRPPDAELPEPAPVAPVTPAEPVPEPPPAVQVARELVPAPSVAPDAPPPPTAPPAMEEEPFQIAARLPDVLPLYDPNPALTGGALDPMRVASVVRSGTAELPRIRALGPEHLGVTREASPTLYWSLDAPTEVPVELTLVAEDASEPLLELRVASPEAGIHALPLAQRGVALVPGTPYLWFASLVPDDARRDLDVVSGAGIVRVGSEGDAELARRLDAAPPERRAHVLAEQGYWYDAFATVSHWLAAEPDSERLRAYRDALLDQAGLPD